MVQCLLCSVTQIVHDILYSFPVVLLCQQHCPTEDDAASLGTGKMSSAAQKLITFRPGKELNSRLQ